MNWEKKFTKSVGSRISVVLHSIFFAVMFSLTFFGIHFDTVLLVLTTLVSLEAIYLSIFIQMTVNQNTESLEDVEEDIEEIQHDVDEIQEDVDEIQQDVDEMEKEKSTDAIIESKDLTKFENIEIILKKLLEEVEKLKKSEK